MVVENVHQLLEQEIQGGRKMKGFRANWKQWKAQIVFK